MTDSHFRRFLVNEWNSTAPPPDAIELHRRGNGQVVAHCAGTSDEYEAAYGSVGMTQGVRIQQLGIPDQQGILVRIIENVAGVRLRQKMNQPVPAGFTVVAENLVPHVWLGQQPSDVA